MDDQIMNIILTSIWGGILTVLGVGFKSIGSKLKQLLDDNKSMKSSVKTMLKSWIVVTYQECEQQGYTTHLINDVTCKMYEEYKTLGGNSYIDDLVAKQKEMEIRGPEIIDNERLADDKESK